MKKSLLLLLTLFTLSTVVMAQPSVSRIDLSIFPKPEKGYKQMVIDVPHSKNDANKKIEFRVGKTMEVDGCNSHGLLGELKKHNLDGWGYNYYTFETDGGIFSTQMACPDMPKRHLFVASTAELTNYNGRLPIVIYIPEEYEVQFKIYTTDGESYYAQTVQTKN